jgi:hypothetical protein
MMDHVNLKHWLKTNCPIIWSLLNRKAKASLPQGLIGYIGSGSEVEIETGRQHIVSVEGYLAELMSACGSRHVGDCYRRDLSAVKSEIRLAELFCEIALSATLGRHSHNIQLRPP